LGVIGFAACISEGVMFDWSGVYFDVINAPGPLVILDIISAYDFMAGGRFKRWLDFKNSTCNPN
jgi:hypothetical protein